MGQQEICASLRKRASALHDRHLEVEDLCILRWQMPHLLLPPQLSYGCLFCCQVESGTYLLDVSRGVLP
eukprot:6173287-Pleurochrysis_carterae.AAC.7